MKTLTEEQKLRKREYQREYMVGYRKKNGSRLREYQAEWLKNNKEWKEAYRENNKEKLRAKRAGPKYLLEQALKFYANPDNYIVKNDPVIIGKQYTEVEEDGGATARKLLKEGKI